MQVVDLHEHFAFLDEISLQKLGEHLSITEHVFLNKCEVYSHQTGCLLP